jgi:hypothetical protein
MNDFETTFEIDREAAEVWNALEHLRSGPGAQAADASAAGLWWLPGFEARCTEVAVDPPGSLTVRKDEWPCEGTLIQITFEHVATGTRIKVVQSGFEPGFVERSGEAFDVVSEQIASDLRLWFTSGILGGRHARPWTLLGFNVTQAPVGPQVIDVSTGTWAERIGLEADDVLLVLAGAPTVGPRDVFTIQRVVRAGDKVAARWARGHELLERVATA